MIVREWQKKDVEEIVLIENQSFSDPWSKEMFLDAFFPAHLLWVRG